VTGGNVPLRPLCSGEPSLQPVPAVEPEKDRQMSTTPDLLDGHVVISIPNVYLLAFEVGKQWGATASTEVKNRIRSFVGDGNFTFGPDVWEGEPDVWGEELAYSPFEIFYGLVQDVEVDYEIDREAARDFWSRLVEYHEAVDPRTATFWVDAFAAGAASEQAEQKAVQPESPGDDEGHRRSMCQPDGRCCP
jgi:hypothetical protein